ncbi:MAG: tetratricopeptide repeat protein [Ignavibacteriaceae bacterium]
MENNNSNIVNDIKSLVNNYMTESESDDLMKVLEEDVALKTNKDLFPSETERKQVEYEFPKGTKFRLLVDRIITECEKLLAEDKFYGLMLDLSQLMLFSGENSFALEIAEYQLNKLNSQNNFPLITAETNLMIGRIHWAQAYWDDCSYYISEAMQIFQSLENKPGMAKCENMLGTLYGEKGEFIDAKNHLENALTYLKDEEDLLSHAMILTNLGIINAIQGDYEKAVWNCKSSIEKFEKLNDTRRLSRVYHNIGMLFSRMEQYDAALDEFNKCITLSLENNYLSNCAVAYIGKAFIYTKLKNVALADAYTNKAMEIAYRINDTLSIADIYKIKGMIQNDLENFQISEELFENSIRLNKDMENKCNEAETFTEIGKLLKKSDRNEEAEKYISSADDYFNSIHKD